MYKCLYQLYICLLYLYLYCKVSLSYSLSNMWWYYTSKIFP